MQSCKAKKMFQTISNSEEFPVTTNTGNSDHRNLDKVNPADPNLTAPAQNMRNMGPSGSGTGIQDRSKGTPLTVGPAGATGNGSGPGSKGGARAARERGLSALGMAYPCRLKCVDLTFDSLLQAYCYITLKTGGDEETAAWLKAADPENILESRSRLESESLKPCRPQASNDNHGKILLDLLRLKRAQCPEFDRAVSCMKPAYIEIACRLSDFDFPAGLNLYVDSLITVSKEENRGNHILHPEILLACKTAYHRDLRNSSSVLVITDKVFGIEGTFDTSVVKIDHFELSPSTIDTFWDPLRSIAGNKYSVIVLLPIYTGWSSDVDVEMVSNRLCAALKEVRDSWGWKFRVILVDDFSFNSEESRLPSHLRGRFSEVSSLRLLSIFLQAGAKLPSTYDFGSGEHGIARQGLLHVLLAFAGSLPFVNLRLQMLDKRARTANPSGAATSSGEVREPSTTPPPAALAHRLDHSSHASNQSECAVRHRLLSGTGTPPAGSLHDPASVVSRWRPIPPSGTTDPNRSEMDRTDPRQPGKVQRPPETSSSKCGQSDGCTAKSGPRKLGAAYCEGDPTPTISPFEGQTQTSGEGTSHKYDPPTDLPVDDRHVHQIESIEANRAFAQSYDVQKLFLSMLREAGAAAEHISDGKGPVEMPVNPNPENCGTVSPNGVSVSSVASSSSSNGSSSLTDSSISSSSTESRVLTTEDQDQRSDAAPDADEAAADVATADAGKITENPESGGYSSDILDSASARIESLENLLRLDTHSHRPTVPRKSPDPPPSASACSTTGGINGILPKPGNPTEPTPGLTSTEACSEVDLGLDLDLTGGNPSPPEASSHSECGKLSPDAVESSSADPPPFEVSRCSEPLGRKDLGISKSGAVSTMQMDTFPVANTVGTKRKVGRTRPPGRDWDLGKQRGSSPVEEEPTGCYSRRREYAENRTSTDSDDSRFGKMRMDDCPAGAGYAVGTERKVATVSRPPVRDLEKMRRFWPVAEEPSGSRKSASPPTTDPQIKSQDGLCPVPMSGLQGWDGQTLSVTQKTKYKRRKRSKKKDSPSEKSARGAVRQDSHDVRSVLLENREKSIRPDGESCSISRMSSLVKSDAAQLKEYPKGGGLHGWDGLTFSKTANVKYKKKRSKSKRKRDRSRSSAAVVLLTPAKDDDETRDSMNTAAKWAAKKLEYLSANKGMSSSSTPQEKSLEPGRAGDPDVGTEKRTKTTAVKYGNQKGSRRKESSRWTSSRSKTIESPEPDESFIEKSSTSRARACTKRARDRTRSDEEPEFEYIMDESTPVQPGKRRVFNMISGVSTVEVSEAQESEDFATNSETAAHDFGGWSDSASEDDSVKMLKGNPTATSATTKDPRKEPGGPPSPYRGREGSNHGYRDLDISPPNSERSDSRQNCDKGSMQPYRNFEPRRDPSQKANLGGEGNRANLGPLEPLLISTGIESPQITPPLTAVPGSFGIHMPRRSESDGPKRTSADPDRSSPSTSNDIPPLKKMKSCSTQTTTWIQDDPVDRRSYRSTVRRLCDHCAVGEVFEPGTSGHVHRSHPRMSGYGVTPPFRVIRQAVRNLIQDAAPNAN